MRSSVVPPVNFGIGSEDEEEDIKAMLSRPSSEMEMSCFSGLTATSSDHPVGLRILIHKPKALTTLSTVVINKVALSRISTIRGVNYPWMLRGTSCAPQAVMGFLEACRLCNKKLSLGKDVYMYRGDQAFCSAACRCERILLDEMYEREEEYLTSKRRRPRKVASPPLRCKDGGNHPQADSHRRRGIWTLG